MKNFFYLFLLALLPGVSLAQEAPRNQIGIGLGHSVIPAGVKSGNITAISLPTWALDYNFRINDRFGIGLHNEVIIESFEFEPYEKQGITLERTHPVATVLVAGYHWREWMFYIGGGAEISKEETYGLGRIGLEYALAIPGELECIMGVNYDLKFDAYQSYGIFIGIAKNF